MDFGFAADRDNILIANEGGSRHFVTHLRKWNSWKVLKCNNLITLESVDHYVVVVTADGDL